MEPAEALTALTAQIAAYQPDRQALRRLQDVPIILAVGISGAGKDTVVARMLARHPGEYRLIVSHTTRPPRKNNGVMEREGVAYHFVTPGQAQQLLHDRQYVEANFYSGNVYGTTVSDIAEAHEHGAIALGDLDVNGADNLMGLIPTANAVFLLPPSFEAWQARLATRYGDKQQEHAHDLQRRMRTARDEIEHVLRTDHFYLVVNDNLDEAAERMNAIAHGEVAERRTSDTLRVAQELLERLQAALV